MNDPTEQAATWFLRLRGDARLAEQAQLRNWLAADPANAEEYRAFEALWNDFGSPVRSKPWSASGMRSPATYALMLMFAVGCGLARLSAYLSAARVAHADWRVSYAIAASCS
ncbi:protein of unknown function [Pseudomonas flavescens]|uniref:FecR N-terminal domain-containing protein n=1 Tax=Phytopseudomonas flavescens TaxID=29435 RepID=A0A1G8PIM7_9GAMM|nr:DUF4880 domain-containing protein [Pseudomonas flavescens]SDI92176.1 protein of unknown function [Pseudomonas flavescens]